MAGIAIGMLLCAVAGVLLQLVDPLDRTQERGAVWAMVAASLITGVCAGGILWYGWNVQARHFGRREGALTVALIWLCCGIFGGLPYVIDAHLSPVDSFFEAISGFTTTGATILADIEATVSRPLALWRSLTQWLGGMGIVVLFVAVFPNLGVGAKHMFRSEVPGPTAEGLQPRIAETSYWLWVIYSVFTVVVIATLWLLGMTLYEAVCHAFTTTSTGGFSPYNASIAHFDSAAIDLALTVFMLAAGVNFGLYYAVIRGRSLRAFLRSLEFRVYLSIAVGATVLIAASIVRLHESGFDAFRYAAFQTATFLTSTGYVTDDYMAYPGSSLAIILLLMFVGGSAGSTAGGMKVARIVLLGKMSWAQIRRSVRPAVVHVVRMGRGSVQQSVLLDVAVFLAVYMASIGLGTLAVSATDDAPIPTVFGAMLSCVSNMGPAPFYVENDHFAAWSDPAKVIFSVAMVLGRLEFFTLLALLLPDFWRR